MQLTVFVREQLACAELAIGNIVRRVLHMIREETQHVSPCAHERCHWPPVPCS